MNKMPDFSFTPSELCVLHDKQFFEIKHAITHKWERFLSHLAENIQKWLLDTPNCSLPDEVKQTTPKISKGENYQGMPYMVLDYPRYFGKEDTCAFRNILLWNRGLHSTWFFEGKYMDYAVQSFTKHATNSMYLHQNPDKWLHELTGQDLLLSIPENVADYNLTLLRQTQKRLQYLKFTKFLSFQEWNTTSPAYNTIPAIQNGFIAFRNFIR